MAFAPTKQQKDIKSWVNEALGFGGALIVQARAGCGKSSSAVWITDSLTTRNWAMTSFGRFSVADLKSKAHSNLDNIRSYNSFGYMGVRRAYPDVKFDEDKISKILAGISGNNSLDKFAKWPAMKLVSMVKKLAFRNPPDDTLYSICLDYDIDLKEDSGSAEYKERVFELAHIALDKSFAMKDVVDFDDQIWFPILDPAVIMPTFDVLVADEIQDTGFAQTILIRKAIGPETVFLGIGDSAQSIFGFLGADSTAMSRIRKELNADELPLSISWRCSQAIGKYVNETFPEIDFQVAPNAQPGQIQHIPLEKITGQATLGDIIVCRTNAPLVSVAFEYIRHGIKATIQGRDIGKSLVALIKRLKAQDTDDLFRKMSIFREKQAQRFMAMDKPNKINQLDDQIATIYALSEDASGVDSIIQRAETIFSDERSGVLLSSIHRAKGLEGENVFILRPDLMPHPRAKTETDLIQESNLRYVSVTRGRNNLVWVHGKGE